MRVREIIEEERVYLRHLISLNKHELIQEISNLKCTINMQSSLIEEYITPIQMEKMKALQRELCEVEKDIKKSKFKIITGGPGDE